MNKSFVDALLRWYDAHGRDLPWRRTEDPYAIWLSEIMLQQTQVQTVIPYYHRFLETLPRIEDLAVADDELLHKLWEGLGYYRRAASLKKAASVLVSDYQGELPDRYQALLKLPGIGPYTAGAIASIAYGERVAAVDGNLMRILARLYGDETPLGDDRAGKHFRPLAQALVPAHRPGDFNQALMDLGASICRANGRPLCEACPLAPYCIACREDRVMALPKRRARKSRSEEHKTVLVLRHEDAVYLEKRPPRGLLASLWQFALLDGPYGFTALETVLAGRGWQIASITALPQATHLFTHRQWFLEGYLIRLRERPALPGQWITRRALIEEYPIPSAFRVYREALLEDLTF